MKKIYTALLLALIILCAGLFYMNIKKPVKVVLLGNFEDERYNFTTSSVVAARIAEKDINDRMGIRGKSTELIVKNDTFDDPDATIKFLKDNKVEAVITTAASQDLLKLKPYLDKNKIVCLSVGATSSSLSKMNDYIFRILPDDNNEVKAFLSYIETNKLNKDIVVIYNANNYEYKNSVCGNLQKLGANIVAEDYWYFDSVNYNPNSVEIMKNKTILILGSARDTAFIVQNLKKRDITGNIFGLSWSGDNYLKSYGGRAIDGFKFITPVDLSSSSEKYVDLTNKLNNFNKSNGLLPAGVYEAYLVIKNGYEEKYEKHISLKESLDIYRTYQGLDGDLAFDEYGDSTGREYIYQVKGGKFVKLGGVDNESAKN